MSDIVEQVEEIAENVRYIRQILKGDDFSPGLLDRVKENSVNIAELQRSKEKSGYSNSTLVAVAWVFLAAAMVASVADRAILISDIRHLIDITASQALAGSFLLGVSSKGFVAVSVSIFITKLILRGE